MRETGSSNQNKKTILHYLLTDLLKDSLLSSPAVSVSTEDWVTEAANLLPHHLETFTDSLVVVKDEKPVGLVGGAEILEGVLKNPSANFFARTRIKEIMSTRIIMLGSGTTLGNLIESWKKTGRAFALMPNRYHGYSAISARRLLEVAMSCKTKLTLGNVSRRKMVTFARDQKIREIIKSMFENNTRKLVLEGTCKFISDRIIIQKISRDLDCLQCADNFLEMEAGKFVLDEAKKVSDKMTFEEGCKILYGMQSPYLILSDGVVTPWDVILSIDSDGMEYVCKPSAK